MNKEKIIAIIPARGGSKRVPKKNLRIFENLPLIVWSINAAKKSKFIDKIIVSSDDHEVLDLSIKNGVEIHKRPKVLSTDKSSTKSLLDHLYFETEKLKNAKYLVLLQPTTPLRTRNSIDSSIVKLSRFKNLDGLIEVSGHSHFSGKIIDKIWKPDYAENVRSQDIPITYCPTGGLYIYRCPNWFENKISKRMLAIELEISRVTNIDYEHDFDWASYVYNKYYFDYKYLTN